MYYTDLKMACKAIAIYTFCISVVTIAYIGYIMNGGESSEFYMPFFETDVRDSMQIAGGISIVWFLLYILFAWIMVIGVKREVLGLMLPWLWWTYFLFFSLIAYGIWMLWSYYIFLPVVLAFLILMLFEAWTMYLILVVQAVYSNIKKSQSVAVYLEPDPWYLI